jgi:hypothetical protein
MSDSECSFDGVSDDEVKKNNNSCSDSDGDDYHKKYWVPKKNVKPVAKKQTAKKNTICEKTKMNKKVDVHENGEHSDLWIGSDGLVEKDYNNIDIQTKLKYTRCECCQNYFKSEGYSQQIVYNLEIQEMIVCIHCFFSFNIIRFTECKDLTKKEDECLRYYIGNFTKSHKSDRCCRITSYGRCLLCEAQNGTLPPIFKKNIVEVEQPDPTNNVGEVRMNDIIWVKKGETNFTLVL